MPTQTTPESTFLTVAGKKTQLTVAGEGPPLVYLHSAGGETEWMPFHEALAQHFKVYLPAHPGFALSEGLDQIDDISDMAWHYIDLFEQLGLRQANVVGFSLGAWIGLELAILRPQLVGKLVLTAAAGLHVDGAPMSELFINDLDKLRARLFFDPAGPNVDLAFPRSLEDERILLWLKSREATARVGWNPYLHNPKLARQLHRIACPVKIIWGRHDALIPLAHGHYYAAHLRNASLEIYEECGHMVPFEKSEQFVASVTQFLKQDSLS